MFQDFFNHIDLFGVLVQNGNFTPQEFLTLSSCSSGLRERCLAFEQFWSKFVSKPSQLLNGKKVFEFYKNLTIANLVEDTACPIIEGLTTIHDVYEDRLLVSIREKVEEPKKEDTDDNQPQTVCRIIIRYKASVLAVVSSVEGRIIKKIDSQLIDDAGTINYCQFINHESFFIIVNRPQENEQEQRRYIQDLEIQVYDIEKGTIIHRLALPSIPHVSAYSYHQESSMFCFAEAENAHVYSISQNGISELGYFIPTRKCRAPFENTKYDYAYVCSINKDYVVIGNDSAIIRGWEISTGEYFYYSLGYSEYERDSLIGIIITDNNDIIASTHLCSGGAREDSDISVSRFCIVLNDKNNEIESQSESESDTESDTEKEGKKSKKLKYKLQVESEIKRIPHVDQSRTPMMQLTNGILLGVDGHIIHLDWKRKAIGTASIHYDYPPPEKPEPPKSTTTTGFGMALGGLGSFGGGLNFSRRENPDILHPVGKLLRFGNYIYLQSEEVGTFTFGRRERYILHRLSISNNIEERNIEDFKEIPRTRKERSWMEYRRRDEELNDIQNIVSASSSFSENNDFGNSTFSFQSSNSNSVSQFPSFTFGTTPSVQTNQTQTSSEQREQYLKFFGIQNTAPSSVNFTNSGSNATLQTSSNSFTFGTIGNVEVQVEDSERERKRKFDELEKEISRD